MGNPALPCAEHAHQIGIVEAHCARIDPLEARVRRIEIRIAVLSAVSGFTGAAAGATATGWGLPLLNALIGG
jgi:hypothetical protein